MVWIGFIWLMGPVLGSCPLKDFKFNTFLRRNKIANTKTLLELK